MKKIIIILLLLFATTAHAGEVFFEWDGSTDAVYTLRLTKILLNSGICLGLTRHDYTITGLTFCTITDICERFYPPAEDAKQYGLVVALGGYYKIAGQWVWQGWSRVVLDLWGDFGRVCNDPTAPVLMYSLPYPKGRP